MRQCRLRPAASQPVDPNHPIASRDMPPADGRRRPRAASRRSERIRTSSTVPKALLTREVNAKFTPQCTVESVNGPSSAEPPFAPTLDAHQRTRGTHAPISRTCEPAAERSRTVANAPQRKPGDLPTHARDRSVLTSSGKEEATSLGEGPACLAEATRFLRTSDSNRVLEFQRMKSRDHLIRLKRFQVEERRRRVSRSKP